MNPIADALRAVMASTAGETAEAHSHLASAQRHAQIAARRHRQVVEIAGLVVAGTRERAEGLALVHAAEFPEDTDLLARITGRQRARRESNPQPSDP